MASAKRDIRTLIDSLSEDLIAIATDLVREHVEREVAEWQAKNQKLLARKSAQDEKALRNQKALERIERAAEKRREREEKKAAERALRMEQRALTAEAESAVEKKPRRARRGLLAEEAAKKEAAPAPLFVHKRRRDGEIQQLKRTEEEEAKAKASAANGASTALPEQLQLGL